MLLPTDEVERIFSKVATVRSYLDEKHPKRHSSSLDHEILAQAISDISKLTIEVFEVHATGETVAGTVERYSDGRVIILVRARLSENMLRFVIVKELCHLIIDEKPDWSNDVESTIKAMKVEFDLAHKNGDGVENPSRIQMSEHLALVAAIALMYPCDCHEADMNRVFKGETTIPRIALEYNMPAWAIEMAFTRGEVFSLYPE